ncbi:MAG TPA: hypothetical protein VE081_10560 [Sporichthyaceae bacterium]|nr:hypothetical protein [Sporichthyaceae bacterium]
MSNHSQHSRRALVLGSAGVLVAAGFMAVHSSGASASEYISESTSKIKVADGRIFTATNHLVRPSKAILTRERQLVANALNGTDPGAKKFVTAEGKIRHEYLVVWAGDRNAGDEGSATIAHGQSVNPATANNTIADESAGPDFLAVVDATKGLPTYGKVVNTVTTSPVVENEPHHMQYVWHKGDTVFAGGLYSDITYAFDVSKLPAVTLRGVNLPQDTPCGSIPDAFWTLKDGSAYGTYMGGADVPGPCTYTNGEMRVSNGFGGSPGSIVHMDKNGKTLSEIPAALPDSEDQLACPNYPALPAATCANPHGIQVREDLNRLIASDYAEPRNIVLDPVKPESANVFRDTVRIFDISQRDNAKLVSVSHMPDGPRKERSPEHEEPRGIMETTVTNLPGHKGAFSESMCGGVIYYTADITDPKPVWREVFDTSTASQKIDPQAGEGAGCSGGGWVQTSPDDKYLYHAVIGRGPGALNSADNGGPKQVYMLNIQKLLSAGKKTTCSIDTMYEVSHGGQEKECPTLADSYKVEDTTSGGPHWGTYDNFTTGKDGLYQETKNVQRIAFSDYFVARTNVDGNHKLCILDISPQGKFSLDTSFVDENLGTPCVDFNRTSWPHGDYGDAKPHSMIFVVADEDLR